VSGILARIKALFAPKRGVAPPPVAQQPPASAAPVAEPIETRLVERIAAVEEAVPAVQVAPVARVAPVTQPAPSVPEVPVHPRPPVTAPPPRGGLVLRLETERGSRSTFEVTKSGATIGRGPESTIQLPDLSVSRKHAQIAYKQGE